jgi:hypothetical protein
MYADAFFTDAPQWSRRPGRRLAYFLLPASLLVLVALALLRLPAIEQRQPLTELLVHILANEVEKDTAPPIVEEVATPEEVSAEEVVAPAAAVQPIAVESGDPVDWHAAIPEAVEAASQPAPTYSVNPGFDEKRRVAAEKFRPSAAPVERKIWENVEKDQLGRTVLVSGNCLTVLDDPNVGSRDAFLTFGQFMTTCAFYKKPPQELPFVKEIQARRANQARYGRPAAE